MVAAASCGAKRGRMVWIDLFAVRQFPGNEADLDFRGVVRPPPARPPACPTARTGRSPPERQIRGCVVAGAAPRLSFVLRRL